MITLACLDMAGTTVHDGGTVEGAFLAAVATTALDPERALAYVRETMGSSKIEVFHHLLGNRAAAHAANQAFEADYGRRVAAGEVTPIPGAEAVLTRLRRAGVAVCLTTGFAPDTRDTILDALRWRDRIDLALSPADAGRGRPAPDMVLTAVLRLRIDAVSDVAVAGDTTSDLLSGTRAGASIVAGVLTGAHDRATLAAAPHTHLLDSIVELPDLIAAAN